MNLCPLVKLITIERIKILYNKLCKIIYFLNNSIFYIQNNYEQDKHLLLILNEKTVTFGIILTKLMMVLYKYHEYRQWYQPKLRKTRPYYNVIIDVQLINWEEYNKPLLSFLKFKG